VAADEPEEGERRTKNGASFEADSWKTPQLQGTDQVLPWFAWLCLVAEEAGLR
jgi:hypothetical protein